MKIVKITKIPKNRYEYRTIYIPLGHYRYQLQVMSKVLTELSLKNKNNCVHGFMPGRNHVTNAIVHKYKKYILSMDLENFFDHITSDMLKETLSEEQLSLCFIDNIAKQGLPTSPPISNLACMKLDKLILEFLEKKFPKYFYSYDMGMNILRGSICSYSRYADDLTFGFDNIEQFEVIKSEITDIVTQCGFKVNTKKTKLQNIKNGRVIITGVAIDAYGKLHPTRKTKRKLRSAFHHLTSKKDLHLKNKKISQNIGNTIKGLRESMKNKLPNERWIKKIYTKLELDKQFSLFEFTRFVNALKVDKVYQKTSNKQDNVKDYITIDSYLHMNGKIVMIENKHTPKKILLEFESEKISSLKFAEIVTYKNSLYKV